MSRLNLQTMDILKEKHFSIEFFDNEGLEKVSDTTGLELEELEYEQSIGNYLISQTEGGRYYLFCETDSIEDEITFNSFLRLVAQ